ncbi:MAG: DNA polymerase IV [FCB group bacterium]|nr:DNA polymerase IV [FCB group bacterium]
MNKFRKIIHVDMDAFYASVEQRDNPALRNKPVAVGGSRQRGVVAAASYEARKFGVHSALASAIASRRCPDIIFVKPRFEVYREVSHQIRTIFKNYTELVEPLSLDEAYLDVTENKVGQPSATLIAREIRSKIKTETGLTASAGVSFNKFLAKVASDFDKPDGLTVITPRQADAFLAVLPIHKFYGVGKVTARRMAALGIKTGADLRKWGQRELIEKFGKAGSWYYKVVRGKDDRPVKPGRIRKSLGAERTFDEDIIDPDFMLLQLKKIIRKVWQRADKAHLSGRTVTLKIKYFNFVQTTRSKTLPDMISSEEQLSQVVFDLLHAPEAPPRPVRLLGVTLSNFSTEQQPDDEDGQLDLDFG